MTAAQTVRVVFVDADDGQEIARSELAVTQLPASFEADTTVQLGASTWLVREAQPPTAELATTVGELVLTLRRIEMVPARDVLYSRPTICDPLPLVDEGAKQDADRGHLLEIHEDDWRQVELVHKGLLDVVDAEMLEIRRVHVEHAHRDEDGQAYGFETIYVRSQPVIPLPHKVPYEWLTNRFGAAEQAVALRGGSGLVAGSFAIIAGSLTFYGTVSDESITALCVERRSVAHPGADVMIRLREFMDLAELVLVDWCGCRTYCPTELAAFLDW